MLKGVDLSGFQGQVDFDLLKTGADFVFTKASEGIGFVDATFHRDWNEAKRVGLPRGAYHFARPDLGNAPADEAHYFLNIVGELGAGDLLALDYEVSWVTWNADVVGWCKTFLDTVRDRTGVKPFIYLNYSLVNNYDWLPVVNADYPLWLADYDGSPASVPSGQWLVLAMKQYTSMGATAGVPNRVDLNMFYGDLVALAKYGKQVDGMALTQDEFNAMAAVWWSQVAGGPATIDDMKAVETKTVKALRDAGALLCDAAQVLKDV